MLLIRHSLSAKDDNRSPPNKSHVEVHWCNSRYTSEIGRRNSKVAPPSGRLAPMMMP